MGKNSLTPQVPTTKVLELLGPYIVGTWEVREFFPMEKTSLMRCNLGP